MFCAVLFSSLFYFGSCEHWAVLYAGSNSYENYRHHANVDTIYKLLIDNGFNSEKIIICQYNDIPYEAHNPLPGKLFHSSVHSTNVFPGSSVLNYSGPRVTADLFYKIISGNDILKSTSDDEVFVYYDNHGGPGFLGVPEGDSITADKLSYAFKQLENKKMYKNLLFMISACYSLSMTHSITNHNMAIITSSNDVQQAHAIDFDNLLGVYVTNEFNYGLDLYARRNINMNLGELYNRLKFISKESDVCWVGDEAMKDLKLSQFIGSDNQYKDSKINFSNDLLPEHSEPVDPVKATLRAIASVEEYNERIKEIEITRNRFEKLRRFSPNAPFSNAYTSDYFELIQYYENKFGKLHPDDYGYLQVLNDIVQYEGKRKAYEFIDLL